MNVAPIKVGVNAYQSQGLLGCESVEGGTLLQTECEGEGECLVSGGRCFLARVWVWGKEGREKE